MMMNGESATAMLARLAVGGTIPIEFGRRW
jgi:hypothetical protein